MLSETALVHLLFVVHPDERRSYLFMTWLYGDQDAPPSPDQVVAPVTAQGAFSFDNMFFAEGPSTMERLIWEELTEGPRIPKGLGYSSMPEK